VTLIAPFDVLGIQWSVSSCREQGVFRNPQGAHVESAAIVYWGRRLTV
jgi:hypothetical protein